MAGSVHQEGRLYIHKHESLEIYEANTNRIEGRNRQLYVIAGDLEY